MIPIVFDMLLTAAVLGGLAILLGLPRMIGRARLRGGRQWAALPDATLDERELAALSPGLRQLALSTRTALTILEVPSRIVRETLAAGDLRSEDEEFTSAMTDISKETLQWLGAIDQLPDADATHLQNLGYSTETVRSAIGEEATTPGSPRATLYRLELTLETMARLEVLLRARDNPYR